MKKFRIAAILAALAMITSAFTGCGSSVSSSESESSKASSETSIEESSASEVVSEASADDASSEPEAESGELSVKDLWKLNGNAAPKFETEIYDNEGKCAQPYKKVKSFISADMDEVEKQLKNNSGFSIFGNEEMHDQEIIFVKAYTRKSAENDDIKDDAAGYRPSISFSGKTEDYSANYKLEYQFTSALFDGPNKVSLEIDCKPEQLDEIRNAFYELLGQQMSPEAVDYLFYGGSEYEDHKEAIKASDGSTVVEFSHNITYNEKYNEVKAKLMYSLSNDELPSYEGAYSLDDAGYDPIYPDKMEFTLADIIGEEAGSVDLTDSKNMFKPLFDPFPIFGAEFAFNSVDAFSALLETGHNGRYFRNSYRIVTNGYFNDKEDSDFYINAFEYPKIEITANISKYKDELYEYSFSAEMNFYALFTNGTDESSDFCAEAAISSLKKICPDAPVEVKTFEELKEPYLIEYDREFEGVTIPMRMCIQSDNIGETVQVLVSGKYTNNDLHNEEINDFE